MGMPDDGVAQGTATRAMQQVRREGLMLEGDELKNFKADMWNDALQRIKDTYYQWVNMPEPEIDGTATPSFAALWIAGRVCAHPGLERYCDCPTCSKLGQGVISPDWDKKARKAAEQANEVERETAAEDHRVAELKAQSEHAQAAAAEASSKAASLKTSASTAALDAQRAAARAKAAAARAAENEEANQNRVLVEQNLAHDAEESAIAAQGAANTAIALSDGIATQLHDAKCSSHSGCSNLQGYCCPTFDVAHYHLGDAPVWGVHLGCCNAAAAEVLSATLTESKPSYSGVTMFFSMVMSATIGAVIALKFIGRGDARMDYVQLHA